MSRVDLSSFSSPLDNFLQYVPKEHEKAFRQALYNVFAMTIFLVAAVATYYVSVVMQPFLFPIFWAVLVGFVLHPYKVMLTGWTVWILEDIKDANVPSAIYGFSLLWRGSISLCNSVGDYFVSKVKVILVVSFALLCATMLPLSDLPVVDFASWIIDLILHTSSVLPEIGRAHV